MSEEVLVAIPTGKLEALFFTSNRVIIARTESAGSRFTRSLPFAFFGALGMAIAARIQQSQQAKKTKELSKLTPESILSADKKNFAIPYEEIMKVEFFKKIWGPKVRISAGAGKYEYYAAKSSKNQLEMVNTLRTVLGNKVIAS